MTTRRAALVLELLAIAMAAGCAGLTHRPVPQHAVPLDDPEKARNIRTWNAEEDRKFDGIRYYGTSLYLLVHSDGKGNIVWKILELPDQTKKMSASYHSFFAKVETTMTFANGGLDRSAQVVDATAVPKALIEAVAKVIPLIARMSAEEQQLVEAVQVERKPIHSVPPPQLFKVVPTADGIRLVGAPDHQEILVTVPAEVTP